MNVIGMGIDLVEISRFHQVIKRRGDKFLERLFTSEELAYAKARKTMISHLAARFAAKEAVAKALGAPKGLGLEWKDCEIRNGRDGQPQVRLHGTMRRWSKCRIHISLTHTDHTAAAAVFITSS